MYECDELGSPIGESVCDWCAVGVKCAWGWFVAKAKAEKVGCEDGAAGIGERVEVVAEMEAVCAEAVD